MNDDKFLAIVNPAAGGGRCRKLVGPALDRLRSGESELHVVETNALGHATELARRGYRDGYRKFIAVGGDGTSFEIVNGVFPEAQNGEPVQLWLFYRWAPGILFCGISAIAELSTPLKRYWPGDRVRVMYCGWPIPAASSTTSIC